MYYVNAVAGFVEEGEVTKRRVDKRELPNPVATTEQQTRLTSGSCSTGTGAVRNGSASRVYVNMR